jgi:hypothetical protein
VPHLIRSPIEHAFDTAYLVPDVLCRVVLCFDVVVCRVVSCV